MANNKRGQQDVPAAQSAPVTRPGQSQAQQSAPPPHPSPQPPQVVQAPAAPAAATPASPQPAPVQAPAEAPKVAPQPPVEASKAAKVVDTGRKAAPAKGKGKGKPKGLPKTGLLLTRQIPFGPHLRKVWQAYKSGATFEEIEARKGLRLKPGKGTTAWHCCRKYAAVQGLKFPLPKRGRNGK